jgi:type III secretion system FlhB-like substrate exporter/AAA+ superfamily predicted ATPase
MVFSEIQRSHVVICAGNFLAVALEYKKDLDYAPVVSAKAKGLNTLIVKKIAADNDVPIKQDSELTRNLFSLKIGETVSPSYYELLARVFAETKMDKKESFHVSTKIGKTSFFQSLSSYQEIDKIRIEINLKLIIYVPALKNIIREKRRKLWTELGIIIPLVHITDNPALGLYEYRIFFKEVEFYRGKIQQRTNGQSRNDEKTILADHLETIIKKNAVEFIGRQEVYTMLCRIKETHPVVADNVLEIFSFGQISTVLKNLLTEHVSILNFVDILEAMLDAYEKEDTRLLTESVRQRIGMQICMQYARYINRTYTLYCLTLHPGLEKTIVDAKIEDYSGICPAFDNPIQEKLIAALSGALRGAKNKGQKPVILCTESARYLVKRSIHRRFPDIAVLSALEIRSSIRVRWVGEIALPPEYSDPSSQPDACGKDALTELNELIGLAEVKEKVKEIIQFIKRRRKETLPILHMVFRGNPGTGKTTVARLIGRIFSDCGALASKDLFIETDRAGLVGGYIGQTAIKTARKIKDALGGVLFIDEAYALGMGGSKKDFGHECIATLVKYMEDRHKDFVCILAGYTDKMDDMLKINPGLKDRIQFYIDFPDYSAEELVQIFKYFCSRESYTLETEAEADLSHWFVKIVDAKNKNFSNARIVRKLFERIQMKQNLRAENAVITLEDIESVYKSKDKDIEDLITPKNKRIGF